MKSNLKLARYHLAWLWLAAALLLFGCAANRREALPPNVRLVTYRHCREVAFNAKSGEVTLVCPGQK